MVALRKILTPLASLRLTIVLLAASMFLVLAGTVAQIDLDILQVQQRFFHSWGMWVSLQSFLPRPAPGHHAIHGGIPFVGGYTLIVLLLANLLAAHAVRFKVSWKRIGILLIHFGLILLLVGEILTAQFKHEGQMALVQGQTLNFTQDTQLSELALVDRSPGGHDAVTVIPGSRLRQGQIINDPQLPLRVKVDYFTPNSQVLGPMQSDPDAVALANAGPGAQLKVKPVPVFSGAGDDAEKVNVPSAFVTFSAGDKDLGTYLLSESENLDGPQEVNVGENSYWVQLRPKRYYKPYSITLIRCAHDNYLGSDTPRNFSSDVRIVDPAQHVDRVVKIWMNHPLRFDGDVFYQQAMPNDTTSVLQVVKNPSSWLPYIACGVGALGLLIHFGITLTVFLRRRIAELEKKEQQKLAAAAANPLEPALYTLKPRSALTLANVAAIAIVGIAAIWLSSVAATAWQSPAASNQFNYINFGRIPVTYDGRTMPLDSLARNSLRIISGIEVVHDGDKTITADEWLADIMSGRDEKWVRGLPVFRIDHPEIKSMLGLDEKETRFSLSQIIKQVKPDQLQEQAQQIAELSDKKRDPYQQNLLNLFQHLVLFSELTQWQGNAARKSGLYLVAPLEKGEQWQTLAQVTNDFSQSTISNISATWLAAIVQHAHDGDAAGFNSSVTDYLGILHRDLPATMRGVEYESFFNRFEPFYQCMILYVVVFVLAGLSWLLWPGLRQAVVGLLLLTLAAHTFGLVSRIYLMGRPPVTNLYSSAIFIGWGAVVLALLVELVYRDGLATALAAAVGFVTLFIAHNLAINPALTTTGDTMEMMRAVLDTNLWLATHVVCITLGYATTFLAGVFAIVFVVRGLFDRNFDAEARKSLSRKIYGVVCFAMFFSFVGTILGGIWADQSWGRFWGWDPKENGAILVVLWNALILHARWSGLARQRGVALLAVFGNVVTSWSWFGTNMLGIGLHSYGFMAGAATWLIIFMLSQVTLIAIGSLPTKYWRAYAGEPAGPA